MNIQQPIYRTLGAFTPPTQPTPIIDVHRRAINEKEEELKACYERIAELEAALTEINSQAVCACLATKDECFDMLENCAHISDAVLTPQVIV